MFVADPAALPRSSRWAVFSAVIAGVDRFRPVKLVRPVMVMLLAISVLAFQSGQAKADGLVYSSWEPLGGVARGAPSVTTWGLGRLDVFARGTDDVLWHKWYAGGWSGWEPLGSPPGGLASDPAAVAWGPGRIDVFAGGADGQVWHKWYAGGWSGWEPQGGRLLDAPAVASWGPGRLDLFVEGSDHALYTKSYAGGWSGWTRLGGVLTAGPAAAAWGPGRIDVVVRGSDNSAWHTFYAAGWRGFDPLGGQMASAAGMTAWSAGRLDVYVEGSDSNLYHQWFAGGWSGWQLAATGPIISAPGVAARAPGRVDIVAGGTDNGVYHLIGALPAPPPPPFTFGDGTWRPGITIPAGTFRMRRDIPGCYWERLRGFSGQLGDIITNNYTNFHDVVTISAADAGFRTSGCGTWTSDLSSVTSSPVGPFADGTWIVGTDVAPGVWTAQGGASCYWARVTDFSSTSDIIANGYGQVAPIVAISPGDAGFESSQCGNWVKIG